MTYRLLIRSLRFAACAAVAVAVAAGMAVAQGGPPTVRDIFLREIFLRDVSAPVPVQSRRDARPLPPGGASGPITAPQAIPAPAREFLSPERVMSAFVERGYSSVEDLRRRGDYYVFVATGPRGERVRLVVNGWSGVVEGARIEAQR